MITMSDLIRDPVYKAFLTKPPTLPAHAANKYNSSPPWVVYVQKTPGGKWGKKEFWTYKKAFKFMVKALKNYHVHDAALNCKRVGFEPPSKWVRVKGKYVERRGIKIQVTRQIWWRPKLTPEDEEHHWCKYCRRPTQWKYFSKHKRLGPVDSTVLRCGICGASARIAAHIPSDKTFRVH